MSLQDKNVALRFKVINSLVDLGMKEVLKWELKILVLLFLFLLCLIV